MKKVMLNKSLPPSLTIQMVSVVKNSSSSSPSDSGGGSRSPPATTYQERKVCETAYRDLFTALHRLPKDVQHRVMNAINGEMICTQCSLRSKRKLAETTTQTDIGVWRPSVATSAKVGAVTVAFGLKLKTEPNSNSTSTSDDETTKKKLVAAKETPSARKHRKRKVCIPQVIKKSHAQQAQPLLQPKIKKLKVDKLPKKPNDSSQSMAQRARSDSLCSNLSIFTEGLQEFIEGDGCLDALIPTPQEKTQLHRIMALEFLDSEELQDGLLLIHNAIIKNDRNMLRRQIFVWKEMKKVNLNELITDEDEDCLQLSVVHDSDPEIIEILLKSGLSTSSTDARSNTIIHLALLNEIELNSFIHLLNKIDLSLLVQLNDDGLSPLHIAVRHDLYAHAETLLNVIDERLRGTVVYRRSSANDIPVKEDFLKYYQNACDHLNTSLYAPFYSQLKLKRQLLECGEMRSGNTALFVAIENKKEHFIYFLLAHFSDPRIQNHGGQDAKSFFGEFSKVLNLSLKIDQTMEKIIKA